MNRSAYRLLVLFVTFVILSGQAVLVAAQDDKSETDRALNVVCPDADHLGRLLESRKAGHPGHEYPPIQGLRWHRNDYFSFFVPVSWQQSDWDYGRLGVLYYPEPDDSQTVFTVEVKDLGMVIDLENLDRLDAEFMDAIEQLHEGTIDLHDKTVVGELMQLEYKYTFREGCLMRQRWVRVLYQGTRETTLIAQGSTLAMYQYWLPWFFEAMATAQVHYQQPGLESLESLG